MSLVSSFKNIFVNSVHYGSLLDHQRWHLLVNIGQIVHLSKNFGDLFISIVHLRWICHLLYLQLLLSTTVMLIVFKCIFPVQLLHLLYVVLLHIFQSLCEALKLHEVSLLNILYYFLFRERFILQTFLHLLQFLFRLLN